MQNHLQFVVADPFHDAGHVDPAIRTLADEVPTKIVEGQLLRGNAGRVGQFLQLLEFGPSDMVGAGRPRRSRNDVSRRSAPLPQDFQDR